MEFKSERERGKKEMKKIAALIITLAFILNFSTVSHAVITGSAHDFSANSWNTTSQICVVCHTPHNGDTTITDAPLWNHEVTNTTFTLYNSAWLDAVPGQPSGVSKLCLSCHDGTIAIEDYAGRTGGTDFVLPANNLGTTLANDHPISITYDSALAVADSGLYDPAAQNSGLRGTVQEDLLVNDKLECSSCHDVHNSIPASKLLRIDNTQSGLCLTCHNK
jgi:predicted CXXCH cytochrome family protein